jgi:SAM-dependent methyltransferase
MRQRVVELVTARAQFRRWKQRRAATAPARYRFDQTDTVVSDYAAFAGVPTPVVEANIRTFQKTIPEEWHGLETSDFTSSSERFYATSDYFVYDLLYYNRSKCVVTSKLDGFDTRIMGSIADHRGRRLLDFGAGIGVFCEIARDLGKAPTYIDVPSRVSDFAVWRFDRYRIPVDVRLSAPQSLLIDGMFDVVFSDAVLEHFPPARQVEVIEALAAAVDVGGLLVLLVDIAGPTARNPTHSEVNIRLHHEHLVTCGLTKMDGASNGFWSIWARPSR